MITPEKVAELAPYYEAQTHSKDPIESLQAGFIFRSECKKIYESDADDSRKKLKLNQYIALFITPEIIAHLQQRASKFPTIQPEKK
jgi:hypothetical protein